jgi:exopolysaccharide biosynthesis protein
MRLVFAVVLLLVSASQAQEQTPVPVWRPAFDGVEQAALTLTKSRVNNLFLLRIRLDAPNLSFFATPSNGDRPSETDALYTSSFLKKYGLQAAINAAPFGPLAKSEGQALDISGPAISQGVVVSPAKGSRYPALVIGKNNEASVVPKFNTNAAGDAWIVVSGFHVVLQNGNVVTGNEDLHPRTAVGVSADKKTMIWLVVDGRQRSSKGATVGELGQWLKDFGCADGINLDGGGTTTLVLADAEGNARVVNKPIDLGIPGKQRLSGSHLGIKAAALPAAQPKPNP